MLKLEQTYPTGNLGGGIRMDVSLNMLGSQTILSKICHLGQWWRKGIKSILLLLELPTATVAAATVTTDHGCGCHLHSIHYATRRADGRLCNRVGHSQYRPIYDRCIRCHKLCAYRWKCTSHYHLRSSHRLQRCGCLENSSR